MILDVDNHPMNTLNSLLDFLYIITSERMRDQERKTESIEDEKGVEVSEENESRVLFSIKRRRGVSPLL